MSAPITRIVFIAGLVAISPEPIAINGGNDAQAQPTSKVPAFFAPSLYCRTTAVSGRDVVWRSRAKNDQVDVFGFTPCALERLLGCGQGEVRRHPVVRDVETLGNPRAGSKAVDD